MRATPIVSEHEVNIRRESRDSSLMQDEREVGAAREKFREALILSNKTRNSIGDVEAAAAHFCQALRREGVSPERMLVDAKRVIAETIDDSNRSLAEKAVLSCIQHYYRE